MASVVVDGRVDKVTLDCDLENVFKACKPKVKGRDSLDLKLLQKGAASVKAYLRSESGNVNHFLVYDGFVNFLVKVLQHGGQSSSLQFSGIWIFETIMLKGGKKLVEAVINPDTVAVPMLVKVLQSPDRTIYEKATFVISKLTRWETARHQLIANSSSIFTPLAKHLTKKPSQEFVQNVVGIVVELIFKQCSMRDEILKSLGTLMDHDKSPQKEGDLKIDRISVDISVIELNSSSRLMRHVTGVISEILGLPDTRNEFRRAMLQCLLTSTEVLCDIKPLLESGCLVKVVSCLSDADEILVSYATIMIASVARAGVGSFMEFLRAMRERGGLNNFSKSFNLDKKLPDVSRMIQLVVKAVGEVISHSSNEGVRLAIDSGIVDALTYCVKEPSVDILYKTTALHVISSLLEKLDVPERGIAEEVLPFILEFLKQLPRCKTGDKCLLILDNLLEGNAERRNWAVNMGTHSLLFQMLEKPAYLKGWNRVNVLLCLKSLITVEPRLDVELFTPLPAAMSDLLYDLLFCVPSGELDVILNVVSSFLSYENSQVVDLVFASRMVPLLVMFLSDQHPQQQVVLHHTMGIVTKLCKFGSGQRRKELVSLGILQGIAYVLEFGWERTKALAMRTLWTLLEKTKFSQEEREAIVELEPLVAKDYSGGVLECESVVKAVRKRILMFKANLSKSSEVSG